MFDEAQDASRGNNAGARMLGWCSTGPQSGGRWPGWGHEGVVLESSRNREGRGLEEAKLMRGPESAETCHCRASGNQAHAGRAMDKWISGLCGVCLSGSNGQRKESGWWCGVDDPKGLAAVYRKG